MFLKEVPNVFFVNSVKPLALAKESFLEVIN